MNGRRSNSVKTAKIITTAAATAAQTRCETRFRRGFGGSMWPSSISRALVGFCGRWSGSEARQARIVVFHFSSRFGICSRGGVGSYNFV